MPDTPVTPNTSAAPGLNLPAADLSAETTAAAPHPQLPVIEHVTEHVIEQVVEPASAHVTAHSAEPVATEQVATASADAAPAGEIAVIAEAGVTAPQPESAKPARGPKDMSPAACADLLKQHFPALFGGQPKPLKLRIQSDIAQRAPGVFGKPALSAFFRRHTGSTAYLIALGKSTERFDLDGQPAGELSEEHRQLAREELTRRRQVTRDREQQARAQTHSQARGQHHAPAQDQAPDNVQQAELRAAQAELRAQQAELRAQQAELRVQQAALQAHQAGHQQERQARLALLRDFDRTTLTMANFCALKGMKPETLAPLLAQARLEAAEAPPRPIDDRPRPAPWRDGPQGGQRDDRRDFQRDGRRDDRRDGGGPRGPDFRRDPGQGPRRDPGQDQRPRADQRPRQDARPDNPSGARPAPGPMRDGRPDNRPENRPNNRPDGRPNNRPDNRRDGRPAAQPNPVQNTGPAPAPSQAEVHQVSPGATESAPSVGHSGPTEA